MEAIKFGPLIVVENAALKPGQILVMTPEVQRQLAQKIASIEFQRPDHDRD